MLLPKGLDPAARGRVAPLPDARPSEKIAKLFPQIVPPKSQPAAAASLATPSTAATAPAPIAKPVPLPGRPPEDRIEERRAALSQ